MHTWINSLWNNPANWMLLKDTKTRLHESRKMELAQGFAMKTKPINRHPETGSSLMFELVAQDFQIVYELE